MKIHFTLNDAPYGTERCYNGIRLALALLKTSPKPDVSVFLMGDAVTCAKTGQKTTDGNYNLESMVKELADQAQVVLCGSCMDVRGIGDKEIVKGTERGTLPQLAQLVLEADKVIVF